MKNEKKFKQYLKRWYVWGIGILILCVGVYLMLPQSDLSNWKFKGTTELGDKYNAYNMSCETSKPYGMPSYLCEVACYTNAPSVCQSYGFKTKTDKGVSVTCFRGLCQPSKTNTGECKLTCPILLPF